MDSSRDTPPPVRDDSSSPKSLAARERPAQSAERLAAESATAARASRRRRGGPRSSTPVRRVVAGDASAGGYSEALAHDTCRLMCGAEVCFHPPRAPLVALVTHHGHRRDGIGRLKPNRGLVGSLFAADRVAPVFLSCGQFANVHPALDNSGLFGRFIAIDYVAPVRLPCGAVSPPSTQPSSSAVTSVVFIPPPLLMYSPAQGQSARPRKRLCLMMRTAPKKQRMRRRQLQQATTVMKKCVELNGTMNRCTIPIPAGTPTLLRPRVGEQRRCSGRGVCQTCRLCCFGSSSIGNGRSNPLTCRHPKRSPSQRFPDRCPQLRRSNPHRFCYKAPLNEDRRSREGHHWAVR